MKTSKFLEAPKILLLLAGLVLALASFTSCATKMEMPEMKTPVKPGPTRLDIGYALGNTRVDLYRQTRMVTKFVDGKVVTSTENVAYHPLVARLGNGIIIDANFNICLDLVEVLGLTDTENYTISGRTKFLFWDIKDSLQKAGPKTTFKSEGFINASAEAVDKGDTVEISESIFQQKTSLRKYPDSIDYLPGGIFPDLSKSTIRKEGNKVVVPGFLFNSAIEKTDDATIKVNDYLDITNTGERIAIRFHNLFGESTTFLDFYKNGLTYTRGNDVMAIDIGEKRCSIVWTYNRLDLELIRN